MNKSLDPRVNRLNIPDGELVPKVPLDQFGTFEVFVQAKEGKEYRHEGIVHAPNREMAFLFAKEQFSRRNTCVGLFVVETRNIFVTGFTEDKDSIYNHISDEYPEDGFTEQYEVFHLNKRGKQHDHIGSVPAKNHQHALALAKPEFVDGPPVYNVWVVKTSDILFTEEEDKILWDTLHEKKFRDAADYKAADKIKAFKERQQS
ncbi:phenylacetic acid degradation b [Fulvivirga lutea]|uniref:Phenylacetic acid degradation b n=1 Tax=Fulvivirga lutea TaxID=2810512 RepID=A0A974WGG0_9BACT|nr:phenylacetic acid degradation b [Fulvivirga lutea]QSE97193.1 phenylacetic acid degradation b [Fulvivirga lutea]